MRPTPSDDDEPVGLPPADSDAEGEGVPGELGADTDLDLGEDEDIGLDVEAGIDEPLDVDLVLDAEEEASLLLDSEAADDLVDGGDDVDADGEEYGWTDESEPTHEELDDDALAFDEGEESSDDFGEEGFGDDDGASDLEGFALPPLERDPELDLEADDADADAARAFEGEGDDDVPLAARATSDVRERIELVPGLWCERLPARAVRTELLQRSGRPLQALLAAGTTGIAWDGTLLVAHADDAQPARRALSLPTVRGLAAIKTPSGIELVIAVPDGLCRSGDLGQSVDRMVGWPHADGPSSLALARRSDGGIRLLAALPEGTLHASDDGRSFFSLDEEREVLRVTSDQASSALVLRRGASNQPLLRISLDGGASFEDVEPPVREPERVQDAQVAGAAVLVCRRSPEPRVLFGGPLFGDEGWRELLGAAEPPLRVLTERRSAVAYACVPTGTAYAIVRRSLEPQRGDALETTVELIAELPPELGAALQLAGAHVDGITTLQIGTERGWLRVTILPEGGDA